MSRIAANLIGIRPRERAGARTAGRYHFQANVSVLKLIEWHDSREDYRAVFDLFDDLVLLDSSDNPKYLQFYQIKSRSSGVWKIKELAKIARAGNPPHSILGKLYQNVVDFAPDVDRLCLNSNAPFEMRLADGTTTDGDNVQIAAVQLHPDELAHVDAALDADFAPPRAIPCAPLLIFERTSVGIRDQSTLVIGKLTEFFESMGQSNVAIMALYKSLFSDIYRKTECTDAFADIDELFKKKSLTQTEVAGIFERASADQRLLQDWSTIESDLLAAGMTTVGIIKLKTACINYCRKRAAGDSDVMEAREVILAELNEVWAKNLSTLSAIAHELLQTPSLARCPLEGVHLRAAILVEAYEFANV